MESDCAYVSPSQKTVLGDLGDPLDTHAHPHWLKSMEQFRAKELKSTQSNTELCLQLPLKDDITVDTASGTGAQT